MRKQILMNTDQSSISNKQMKILTKYFAMDLNC